jgi:hypothetical protein
MTEQDPKQVIIEFMSQPEGGVQPDPENSLPPGTDVSNWQPGEVRAGGGFGAKAATVHFLKVRSIPRRQVHALAFEDEEGSLWHFICFLVQDTEGHWHVESGGGGSNRDIQQHSGRNHPRANLAGGGWQDHFWAGGYVIDDGFDVVQVNLTSNNGQKLEDSVEDGLVLFVTDKEVHMPVQAELYNHSGELVGKHSLFPTM